MLGGSSLPKPAGPAPQPLVGQGAAVARKATTAAYDGYCRYSFAGTATTSAVSAAGDCIDVQ